MWIKRTKAKINNQPVTYLQLVKTVYTNGRSKQFVVANLGREDCVDVKKAERLAKAMKDDTYLFFSDDLLELLPMRNYGETFLLNKAYEITSLRRFVEDLAVYRAVSLEAADVLLLLFSYYSFRKGDKSLHGFLQKYFVRNIEAVNKDSLLNAFRILNSTPIIHPGITTNYQNLHSNESLKYFYLVPSRVSEQLQSERYVSISIIADEYGFPLHHQWINALPEQMPLSDNPKTVHVTTKPDSRFFESGIRHNHFISHMTRQELMDLFPALDTKQYLAQKELFIPYREMEYTVLTEGGYRIVILRATGNENAPWEALITNLDIPAEMLLLHYAQVDSIANIFFELFLPTDAQFLLEHFSCKEMMDMLVSIHFMRLFLENQLSIKLRPLNMTAGDAFEICRSIRILPLRYGNRRQYIHNQYTPGQMDILNLLAFF